VVLQGLARDTPNFVCGSCKEQVEAKRLLFAADAPKSEHGGTPPICGGDLQRLAGRSFEHLLNALFAKMGFQVVVTQETRDQGADLVLTQAGERVAVQAKRQLQDVGNAAVQALLGGMLYYECPRGIVVTTSGFTASARELAARHSSILLWGGTLVERLCSIYLADSTVLLLEAERSREASGTANL